MRNFYKSFKTIILLLTLLIFGVSSAWGNTWTVKVGIGTSSVGKGKASAQIYSDAIAAGGVQKTTNDATTTSLEEETWSSSLNSTKAHCIYTATPNAGYHFTGWYGNKGCTGSSQTSNPYSGPSEGGKYKVLYYEATSHTYTYYAKFAENSYSVKFHANTGTGSDVTQSGFTYGTNKALRGNTFTKTGYSFAGWATSANGTIVYSDKQEVSIATTSDGATVDLYAKWTANKYDVTLNANGGSSSDQVVQATYAAAMPTTLKAGGAISVPTRTDYTFVGYYDAQTGGNKYYNAELTSARTWNYASDKTLYAHWEATYYGRAESYSTPAVGGGTWVSCNNNKPSKPADYKAEDSSNWQSATTLASAPSCSAYFEESQADGYKFVGWYTGANGTGTLKSSAVSYTEEFSVTAVNTNPRTTIKRYAYFVPVTVNSVSPATTSITFTKPETKSVTLTFNVSNADAKADFNTPVISNTADWSLTSWSYANNQVTVVVSMTVTGNVTTSGAHNTTVTLTSKGASDSQSKSATINATVNMNPVITCNIADNYMVDAPALDLNTLWTSTSNGTKTYSIVSFTPANSNDVTTAPAIVGSTLSLSQAGTVELKLEQAVSTSYNAAEATKAITIHKYISLYAGVSDLEVLVDENVVSGHTLTYTKPNAAYVGAADHAAPAPTLGENSSNCFYTLSHFVTTDITEGSADATKTIAYDAASKTATGKNQGVGTVALTQIETYKYNAATDTFRVMVSKHSNALTCSWGDWVKAMNKNANASVTFGSNNTNYAQTPIQITQTSGEDVAELADNSATEKTITTNTTNGYATWYLYQEANYRYNSAEADVMVTVGVPAPPTCYVFEDYTTHSFSTHINDWEGHFDTPIAINAPVDKIWFTACRQFAGVDYFVVQYSVDNGAHWRTVVDNPGLSTSDKDYGPYSFPGLQSNEKVTHIRFGAKQGATLTKWYKNIKVSRKAYINIQDAGRNNIATMAMPANTIGNTTEAKIYVDYSTCADEIYIESNNEHFTLSKSQFTANGDNRDTQKEEITISYTNSEVSKDTAIISVYTSYQRKVIRVMAETNKRAQTLTWQDGFDTDPITVPVGLVVDNTNAAVLASSNNSVTYTSGNEEIIKIINNGYGFQVVGAGETTITANESGNDTWLPISETRNIVATDKIIQEISWHQTFPRTMAIGEEIDLDAKVYLRNTTTGEKTYSADRTAYLTYSCPNNNGIITILNGQMTVVGYGTTTITARVPGNDDYEDASPVTVTVVVRAPSTGCETPLMFYQDEPIELFLFDFSFTDWETPQITSDPINFDLTQGKPDKLSFRHEGESFSAIGREFFGGTVLVEEHVNNSWNEIPNSRVVPTKNEWNGVENLQLSEEADAIRFIRLAGGTGYHYINDIQVTLRQYLRTSTTAINFGDVKVGEVRPQTIVLNYSDLKGDIVATQSAVDGWLTIANGGMIDTECGAHGEYNLQISFAPLQKGEWKDTIVIIDNIANLELSIPLQANVLESDLFIFEVNGDWGTETNWNTNTVPAPNADVAINADVRISTNIAVNSLTISEDATVTIQSGYTLTIGEGKSSDRLRYGNLHIEDGAKVVIAEKGKLKINDLHLDASMGSVQANRPASSGEVRGQDSLAINGESYFQIVFDPDQISYGWYDFVVPFDVEMAGGIYLPSDLSTPLANKKDFVIMEFNEDKRALNTRAWTWVNGGTLKAGKLYTIAFDDTKPERNAYVFKKNAGANIGSTEYAATYSEVGVVKDRGWNGLGNGTLQHCQLNTLPAGTKIQIYDHEQDRYVEREAAEYTYAIGTAFFVQVDEPKTIDLTAVSEQRGFLLPSRIAQTTDEFRLALSRQGETIASDHLWVSANEEATGEYVIGRDLLKMGTPETAKVAQMWATRNDMILCDAEMPLINNAANVNITLCTPYEGNYKLAVEKAPEDADLFLTYKGNVIWNLSSGPYAFKLAKGTTEDYGLRIEARTEQVAPGNNNGALGEEAARKVLINNMLYIVSPEGKIYDATGKSVQ